MPLNIIPIQGNITYSGPHIQALTQKLHFVMLILFKNFSQMFYGQNFSYTPEIRVLRCEISLVLHYPEREELHMYTRFLLFSILLTPKHKNENP